jgi:hypothetical protein
MTRPLMSTLVLLTALGCGGSTGLGESIDIHTRGVSFSRDNEAPAHVPFVIENHLLVPIYLERCGSAIMTATDRRDDEGWVPNDATTCITVYPMLPLILGPGTRVESAVGIAEAGTYRIRVGVATRPSHGYDWTVVSNTFVVE